MWVAVTYGRPLHVGATWTDISPALPTERGPDVPLSTPFRESSVPCPSAGALFRPTGEAGSNDNLLSLRGSTRRRPRVHGSLEWTRDPRRYPQPSTFTLKVRTRGLETTRGAHPVHPESHGSEDHDCPDGATGEPRESNDPQSDVYPCSPVHSGVGLDRYGEEQLFQNNRCRCGKQGNGRNHRGCDVAVSTLDSPVRTPMHRVLRLL